MHNNYYFLRQLTSSLARRLDGTVISECFSQTRDELIIRFETASDPFFIRASLDPSFSCVSFPRDFQRARKNSIDLFGGIIGHRVKRLRQYTNERSFSIILDGDKTLLFKLHGNRSNIILMHQGEEHELFRTNQVADRAINPDALDREIDWSLPQYLAHADRPEKIYFTLGPLVWDWLEENGFGSKTREAQWEQLNNTVRLLDDPGYYLCERNNKIHFSLLPFSGARKLDSDPAAAVSEFFYAYTVDYALAKEKNELIARLRNKISAGKNYYEKNFRKLTEVESDSNYKAWADLIMANLHAIPSGAEKVTVSNFYNNDLPVEIRLKKELNPQMNAAVYYRKAKNQHIEIERLQQSLEAKEKELAILESTVAEVNSITDLRTLRARAAELQSQVQERPENLPYHEFVVSGFRIWVGKNAEGNDELTLRHGYKEDLWLHAKDVAGSHVLVKYQSGKKFPKDVIERAAQLAAYNSKRRTDTLCPVIVTPKKFVRKRKGDPAGAVVVEREDVILVEPKLN